MGGLLKNIIPFLLLSVLVTGGVETFYRVALPRLLRTETPAPQEQIAGKGPTTGGASAIGTNKQPDIGIIVKRNLFQAQAKIQPAAAQKPTPTQPSATTLDLGLLGTITGPPKSRRAIILIKKTKTQDLYYEGDAVQGAFVKEVQRGKVILDVNGKDEVLIPDPPKSAPATANNPGAAVPESPPMPEEPSMQEEPPALPEPPPEAIIEPPPLTENTVMEPEELTPPRLDSSPTPTSPPPVPANSNQKQVVP